MKLSTYVKNLKADHDELKEKFVMVTGRIKKMSAGCAELTRRLKSAEAQILMLTEVLNELKTKLNIEEKVEPASAMGADGESWDPSLGPRNKKNTAACAVARPDAPVAIKKRHPDKRAAKKDNR